MLCFLYKTNNDCFPLLLLLTVGCQVHLRALDCEGASRLQAREHGDRAAGGHYGSPFPLQLCLKSEYDLELAKSFMFVER